LTKCGPDRVREQFAAITGGKKDGYQGGVQEFTSSRVQEFKSSGVQEFESLRAIVLCLLFPVSDLRFPTSDL
jgi:hypothetical protein